MMHEQIQKILEDKIHRPSYGLKKRILPLLEKQEPIKNLNLLGMKMDWCDLLMVLKIMDTITGLEFLGIRSDKRLSDENLLPLMDKLQNTPTLQSFTLKLEQLGYSGLSALAQLIRNHPNLKAIYIDIDSLDDQGVCLLTDAIKQNVQLFSVYIGGKRFEHQGIQALIDLFDRDRFKTGGFECSTLGENDQYTLAETLEMLKNMTSLVLGFDQLSNLDIIMDALRKNRYIQKINITNPAFEKNEVLQQEVKAICQRNKQQSQENQEKYSSSCTPN